MNIRKRITAVATMLAVVSAGLLVAGAPAQAFPDGCRILSPWAAYPASWNPAIITTNRFITADCGDVVNDLDVTRVQSAGGVPQCVYMRVELFYADGRSAGAFSMNGPWTWQFVCDQDTAQPLLDDLTVGTKYDIQMTAPVGTTKVIPIWLGYLRD